MPYHLTFLASEQGLCRRDLVAAVAGTAVRALPRLSHELGHVTSKTTSQHNKARVPGRDVPHNSGAEPMKGLAAQRAAEEANVRVRQLSIRGSQGRGMVMVGAVRAADKAELGWQCEEGHVNTRRVNVDITSVIFVTQIPNKPKHTDIKVPLAACLHRGWQCRHSMPQSSPPGACSEHHQTQTSSPPC